MKMTAPPMAKANTRAYGPELTIARSTNSFGSDHVSFQRAGIPAIRPGPLGPFKLP